MHWHIDLAVITIAGTYYYLCSVLDGYSRAVVAWPSCWNGGSPEMFMRAQGGRSR